VAAVKRKLTDPVDVQLLKAIHACARENGVDRDGLHEAIEAGYNKKSLKDLTRAEAFRLMDGLRGDKPSAHFKRRRDPNYRRAQNAHGRKDYDASSDAIYPAGAGEHQLLKDAAALRNWDDAKLTHFINRQLAKPVVGNSGRLQQSVLGAEVHEPQGWVTQMRNGMKWRRIGLQIFVFLLKCVFPCPWSFHAAGDCWCRTRKECPEGHLWPEQRLDLTPGQEFL